MKRLHAEATCRLPLLLAFVLLRPLDSAADPSSQTAGVTPCQIIQCMNGESSANSCESILSEYQQSTQFPDAYSADLSALASCADSDSTEFLEEVKKRYSACSQSFSLTQSCGQFKSPTAITGVCHFLAGEVCRNFEVMNVYVATASRAGIAGFCNAKPRGKTCIRFVRGLVLP